MYNNPYMNTFNPNYGQQNMNEKIDNQIAQLQQMKEQIKSQQPTAINQTFQLSPPNNHTMKYVNTIDDVQRETVIADTPFFSKDMSVLWIKNGKGEIKSYELTELVERDEKDIQISLLQQQINELKGMIKNEQSISNVDTKQSTTNTTTNDEPIRTTIKKSEPTSVQKVSGSKKK